MSGVRRGVMLVTLLLALLWGMHGAAQVVMTSIQDTVYRADGTAASGSVVVTWPTFTTAAGQVVAAGTKSAAIGPAGAVSLWLTPNVGAMPMGTYYTAVLHLDDGTTSRQYWVVPVSATAVKISAIENQVLPTSVAMQTVSRAYVDAAVAKVAAAQTTTTTTGSTGSYVLKTGDTMTGALLLPGDPVTAFQAADKNYVDQNVTAIVGGMAQKVSLLPVASQTVAQPAGTQLQVNALNGQMFASQFQTGDGGNGIANVLASSQCAGGCDVVVDAGYGSGEGVGTPQIPQAGHVSDRRYGADLETFVDPLNHGSYSTGESLSQISTRTDANSANVGGNSTGTSHFTLNLSNSAMAGGANQLPGNVENPPYGKATYGVTAQIGNYYTMGQHVQNTKEINCYAVGDCLAGSQYITSSGGYRDMADEGAHPFDLQVAEDYRVFQGTCAGGCTTGSTSLMVNATGAGGTQGEGRFLIDKNPAKTLSTGSIVSAGGDVLPIVNFSGTNFVASVFLETAAAATSQPKNLAPGTVTLPIWTSGVPAGFASSTSALPAQSGVACVADTNDSRFPNFETASYTVVDGSHITLTLNKVHGGNAVLAVGGMCGYGVEQTVDTIGGIRQVFPVIGSKNATALYYAAASTPVLGNVNQASTSGFQNVMLQVASIARKSNVVTVTTAGGMPVDLNGLTLTVSGVADASYNGSFKVTMTNGNVLTYANTGADSTSTGGTVSLLTGGYVLYPMAEVVSVYNATTKQVDGLLTLAPNTVQWAQGDAVEEPHYHQQLVDADTEFVTQYTPRPFQYASAGKQYQGEVGPGVRGWVVTNSVAKTNYLGGGGTRQLPDDAYMANGPWKTDFEVDAGTLSLIRAHCNVNGCNRWDSGYSLFALDSATGEDFLYYAPQTSTAQWTLGGAQYTFTPSGFNANTVNASTVTTTALTAGSSGRAQIAAGGTSGYSNFTLNGNNADGSRIGFIGGGTSDPNLYLDVPAGGTFSFRVNNIHDVTLTGASGGTVQTNVLQTQQVTGSGSTPSATVGSAAGTGASGTVSGTMLSGVLTVTTGTAPVVAGMVATVGWALPSGTAPQGCTVMPRNAAAAGASGTVFTGAPTTSGWTLNVGSTALAAGTSYAWSYQCM